MHPFLTIQWGGNYQNALKLSFAWGTPIPGSQHPCLNRWYTRGVSWLPLKHNYWFLGGLQGGSSWNTNEPRKLLVGHLGSLSKWMSVEEWKRPFPELLWCSPDLTVQESYSITKSQGRRLTTVCFACSLEVCWCLLAVIVAGCWDSHQRLRDYVPTMCQQVPGSRDSPQSLPCLNHCLLIWAGTATGYACHHWKLIHPCSCGWPRCSLLPAEGEWQRGTLQLRYSFSSLTAPLHFCLAFLLYRHPHSAFSNPVGCDWCLKKWGREEPLSQPQEEKILVPEGLRSNYYDQYQALVRKNLNVNGRFTP